MPARAGSGKLALCSGFVPAYRASRDLAGSGIRRWGDAERRAGLMVRTCANGSNNTGAWSDPAFVIVP